jgi:hypothetical protein
VAVALNRAAPAAALAALVAAVPARGAPSPRVVAHPNPFLADIQLDYDAPLRTPTGETAALPPLAAGVMRAAVRDQRYLAYQRSDDLGGFVPATVGDTLASGGHDVIGLADGRFGLGTRQVRAELPVLARAVGGWIVSFAFSGRATGTPPDNGRQPLPGLGVPTPPPPPTGPSRVPPPNQGFGGRPAPKPKPPGGGTTTTSPTTTSTTTTPPPTTTEGTTPTLPTTTAPTPATPAGGGAGGGGTGGGGSGCGTTGLSIVSDLSSCRIDAVDMRPGDSTTEHVTVTNTSGSTYTLSLEASGVENHLWQDLQMGVWDETTAPPAPLPPLLYWTTSFNTLATLAPGESITFVIELHLPTSASNVDQSLVAVIDFTWQATG